LLYTMTVSLLTTIQGSSLLQKLRKRHPEYFGAGIVT